MKRTKGNYWSEKRKLLYQKNTKAERNNAILRDYKKLSLMEMVLKYRISASRIFFIIKNSKPQTDTHHVTAC